MKKLAYAISLLAVFALMRMDYARADARAKKKKKVVATMTLTSSTFQEGGVIPTAYTCDDPDPKWSSDYWGGNSVDVTWTKPPKGTKSVVLLMYDADAPGGAFYHWGLLNIKRNVKSIAAGSTTGVSTFCDGNMSKYFGPCAPPTGEAHRYVFEVYALNTKITVPKKKGFVYPTSQLAGLLAKKYKKNIIGKGALTGTYTPTQITKAGCSARWGNWYCSTPENCTCN